MCASRWSLGEGASVCALVLAACSPLTRGPVVQEPSRAAAVVAHPASFEAELMTYNVLYGYGQVANPDGSFPAWVCETYPHVVDHPELRWEHRFPALVATIEQEQPDILGLNEMRGGVPVAADARAADPHEDRSPGPPMIHDLTRWMRDGSSAPYAWISVFDLAPDAIAQDPAKSRDWLAARCRPDMSQNGCRQYDPRTDHYSAKNFLAYRRDRYRVLESGAIEIPTSSVLERRFAPWARLEERSSGLSVLVMVTHLDPHSGAHRIEAARRILAFVEGHSGAPIVVLGDFNARSDRGDECQCSCGARASCSCPEEITAGCHGESTYRVLTAGPAPLVDTFVRAGGNATQGTTRGFRAQRSGAESSGEPCWPAALAGEGRQPAPPITIDEIGVRIDYVFATPDLEVLSSAIVSPQMPTIDVQGEPRAVRPSDHLAVTTTVRVGARSSGAAQDDRAAAARPM